jgi:hypothetical protein
MEDLEAILAEQEEREKRFKLVYEFIEERVHEIRMILEISRDEAEREILRSFALKGDHAVIALISQNDKDLAKEWLDEYKHDLALRERLPELYNDEVIDAIRSTIDQEPN